MQVKSYPGPESYPTDSGDPGALSY